MNDRVEQGPVALVEGEEREWANWWRGYWSDLPEGHDTEMGEVRRPWRESAHEFDFGGGEE